MDRNLFYLPPDASVTYFKYAVLLCQSGNIEQWYEDDID